MTKRYSRWVWLVALLYAAPAAAQEIWANNAVSTLASGINGAAVSITVVSGTNFPSPTGSQFMYLTLEQGSTIEIIKCTSRSSGVISGCTRAQQGTSASSFTSGATVENRVTRVMLEHLQRVTDYQVTDYGALCDGSTDDHAAIQAAFDAAEGSTTGSANVLFPGRTCMIGTTTLTLGNGDGPGDGTTFINLVGVSPATSILNYSGTTVALDVRTNKYFKMEGLGVIRGGGSIGTTIGIRLNGVPGTGGTQTLAGELSRVNVQSFHIGIEAGKQGGDAASEYTYRTVGFDSNDIGWVDHGLNTLDHFFWNVLCGSNGICIQVDSGNAYIDGGSISYSTVADFYLGGVYGADGTVTIRNVRSEHAEYFVYGAAASVLLLEGNMIASPARGDGVSVYLNAGVRILRNNFGAFKVQIVEADRTVSYLEMVGNKVYGDDTNLLPFIVKASGSTTDYLNHLMYSVQGNMKWDTNTRYRDEDGLHSAYQFIPYHRVSINPVATYNVVMPTNFIRTQSVGENWSVMGKNLRAGVKFASAGTAAIDFARSITVTKASGGGPGFKRYDYTGATLTNADLGKLLTITDGGDTAYAYITSFIDADTFETQMLQDGDVSAGAHSAVIGQDEDDAYYVPILSCGGASGETFQWSSLAATGFTITSSSGSSTATCYVAILR